MVALVQADFQEGKLAEEATRKAVVLITKGVCDYRGIGLVKVVWKEATTIINCCFTASTNFHDVLHGLREGLGTGTASIEANLLQQLTSMREEVLYSIFLGVHK